MIEKIIKQVKNSSVLFLDESNTKVERQVTIKQKVSENIDFIVSVVFAKSGFSIDYKRYPEGYFIDCEFVTQHVDYQKEEFFTRETLAVSKINDLELFVDKYLQKSKKALAPHLCYNIRFNKKRYCFTKNDLYISGDYYSIAETASWKSIVEEFEKLKKDKGSFKTFFQNLLKKKLVKRF